MRRRGGAWSPGLGGKLKGIQVRGSSHVYHSFTRPVGLTFLSGFMNILVLGPGHRCHGGRWAVGSGQEPGTRDIYNSLALESWTQAEM
ncbi:hypothetical protein KC19_1G001900 [Ceratodon purpureus]|uniref:Uncharacterized protein n=1 Tax=Ceratodon purpureus TaxID=3225 RepID=A0A8T0J1T4_CERPU|nr:hypothetical protein KC19_1G001900 [Ceratodon purpureus]